MGIFSFFSKEKKETLDKGLSKTKENVFSKITRAIAGKSKVDDEVLDNLEEVLITSDVGVDTTLKIISRIEDRVARDKYVTTSELTAILREEIASLLTENHTEDLESFTVPEDKKPYVIMVVGVNGVGKTTTIGKLAYQFKKAGKNVYLGAADTFRAAAVEQLVIWSERVGVPIVKQKMGSDPASVAFDTLSSAKANGADVVIIDEMSMVDLALFSALLRALRPGTRLVLVGDADQLPSVGAGNVFSDLIRSKKIETGSIIKREIAPNEKKPARQPKVRMMALPSGLPSPPTIPENAAARPTARPRFLWNQLPRMYGAG